MKNVKYNKTVAFVPSIFCIAIFIVLLKILCIIHQKYELYFCQKYRASVGLLHLQRYYEPYKTALRLNQEYEKLSSLSCNLCIFEGVK